MVVVRGIRNKCLWSEEQLRDIVERYDAGAPSVELAADYEVHNATMTRLLHRETSVRPKGALRTHDVDDAYFDEIDTEEKAYWLGFILTDGCIGRKNNVIICLKADDAPHLELLLSAISSSGVVAVRTNAIGYEYCRTSWTSAQMVNALASYSIVPRKAFVVRTPDVDDRLMNHFWRGVIDGDGCISRNKKGHWLVSLVGTHSIVSGFADFARAACGTTASVSKRDRSFRFAVGGSYNVREVLDALYEGSTEKTRLERKYNKYVEACATCKPR